MINPLTTPGEGVTVFTSPYLSVGVPAPGEAKGLIQISAKSYKLNNKQELVYIKTYQDKDKLTKKNN